MAPVSLAGGSHGVTRVAERELAQVHAVRGTATFGSSDPRRWAMALLASSLGGGMSSRLFQEIREKRGLCYSVYAFHWAFADSGMRSSGCSVSGTRSQPQISVHAP